jgi:hypothetical protein
MNLRVPEEVYGDPAFAGVAGGRWDPIALNYTSGTRGDSKRVVPSHRSAYPISVLQIVGGRCRGTRSTYGWAAVDAGAESSLQQRRCGRVFPLAAAHCRQAAGGLGWRAGPPRLC